MNFKNTVFTNILLCFISTTVTGKDELLKMLQSTEYSNVLFTPINIWLLNTPSNKKPNIIVISSGQEIDDYSNSILRTTSEENLSVVSINTLVESYLAKRTLVVCDNDMTVTLIDYRHQLGEILTNHGNIYWNKRSNFMFIFTFTLANEECIKIFRELWEMRILKVSIIFVNVCSGSTTCAENFLSPNLTLKVASYNPFLDLTHIKEFTLESIQSAITVLSEAYSPSKLRNLNGYTLKTGTLYTKMPPYFSFWRDPDGTYQSKGYYIAIFQELSKYMNYTNKHVTIYDWWKYGHKQPNGTWVYLIGDIIAKRIDFTYSSIGFNFQRYAVMEFSEYVDAEAASILVPKGKHIPSWISLLFYEPDLFVSIVALFAIQVCFLRIVQKLNFHRNVADFHQCGLHMFGILVQVSVTQPKYIINRIIFSSWTYFCLVLSFIYAGGILSIMTVPQYYPSMNSFKDLATAQLTLNGFTFFMNILNDKSNKEVWALYKLFKEDGNYDETVRNLIRDGNVTAIAPYRLLQYYGKKHHTCVSCSPKFHIMKENFGFQPSGIGVPQGSVFVSRFNVLIRRIRESGLISKWFSEELQQAKSNEKCKTLCDKYNTITLEHIQSAFYVITIGLFCAFTTLIFEIIHSRCIKDYTFLCHKGVLKS